MILENVVQISKRPSKHCLEILRVTEKNSDLPLVKLIPKAHYLAKLFIIADLYQILPGRIFGFGSRAPLSLSVLNLVIVPKIV